MSGLICARQSLGMTDNCALCKAIHPKLYDPCRGEPGKVNPPIKKPQSEPVIIRKLSYEEAEEEIIKYIQNKTGKLYISEISESLKIDIEMVAEIMEEL